MWSDLTLGPFLKFKTGLPNLKALKTLVLLLPYFREEIMGWESSDVVRFGLGPLLQGQMMVAKLKLAYNSLIIGPRVWGYEANL